MKQIKEFFELESNFASKHILNTCNKIVPQMYLDKIENGCSIEQIESLSKKGYDIYKYRTQITIHGLFPQLSTRRIGGYVNLTQNKNKSIGVRYNAIDYNKKSKLYDMVCTIDKKWHAEHNSQVYRLYKIELLPDNWKENKDKILAIVERYRHEAESIDRTLFVGTVSCYIAQDLFRYYMVLALNIQCFYESNFERLFENISGMTYSDCLAKFEEIKAQQMKERAERELQWEQERIKWQKEQNDKKRAEQSRKQSFIENNPLNDFCKHDVYQPKQNDILAGVHADYDGKLNWKFYLITKSFGRLCLTECNRDGIKLQYAKGHEARRTYNNVYVKQS